MRAQSRIAAIVYFVTAVGALLIVAALAWLLYYRTRPEGLNQARIQERIKNLRDINTAGAEGLNTYGWLDQSKGIIRIPITNAMEWTVRIWKDPAAARSNLLTRVDKANPAPPPPPPPKPSQFE